VIDSDLRTAWTRLETARSAKTAEEELLGALSLDEAVTKTRLSAVFEEKKRAEVMVARRRGLERAGSVASETAGVLDELSTTMSQQIRPALEGAVGELLGRMSDGRFDAVSLDEDYNLSVRDDGALRPLSEFSGGEIDLIALAMRLALSGVVAERHGAGGAGFLILDECFGSQDAERRESIMTALRGLRGSYGQILLISHVGGIEDAADVVVEVSVDSATGVSTASIV